MISGSQRLDSRLYTRYLPAALTAVQAAANAATARTIPAAQAQREAQIITEAMSMPVPSINNNPSDGRRGLSRTSQYASTEGIARLRTASDQYLGGQGQNRSVSNPPQMGHRGSEESISGSGRNEGSGRSNRSSRSSLAGIVPAYGEMSGYETINREDVVDATGSEVPEALRPGQGPRRGSGWFGWGAAGSAGNEEGRSKVE